MKIQLGVMLACCILMTDLSQAQDLYVSVPLTSYHADRDAGYNENNLGIGIEYDGFVAGYYKNSIHKDTFYAGYVYRPIEYKYFKAGVLVGAMTGYAIPVMAVPTVNIGTDDISVDFIFAPAFKDTSAFVGASLRFRID